MQPTQSGQYAPYVSPHTPPLSQPYQAAYAYLHQQHNTGSTNQLVKQLAMEHYPPRDDSSSITSMLVSSSFAEQVHFDAKSDAGLVWILETAWRHPLPPRWEAHLDGSYNEYYYVNVDDGQSSWEHPLAPYVRQLFEIGRGYRSGQFGFSFDETLGKLKEGLERELSSWFGPFTSDGGIYFVNSGNQQSTWEDPRQDAQVIHDLQQVILTKINQLHPLRGLNKQIPFPLLDDSYLTGKGGVVDTSTPKFGAGSGISLGGGSEGSSLSFSKKKTDPKSLPPPTETSLPSQVEVSPKFAESPLTVVEKPKQPEFNSPSKQMEILNQPMTAPVVVVTAPIDVRKTARILEAQISRKREDLGLGSNAVKSAISKNLSHDTIPESYKSAEIKPTEPVKPVEPVKPIEPVKPVEPVEPVSAARPYSASSESSAFNERLATEKDYANFREISRSVQGDKLKSVLDSEREARRAALLAKHKARKEGSETNLLADVTFVNLP